jgi:hypothetical protein
VIVVSFFFSLVFAIYIPTDDGSDYANRQRTDSVRN